VFYYVRQLGTTVFVCYAEDNSVPIYTGYIHLHPPRTVGGGFGLQTLRPYSP